MEKIIGNPLMMLSGWGTGLAVLFALFNRRVSWSDARFAALDTLLSVAVAMLFLLTVAAFATGLSEARKTDESNDTVEKHKVLPGLLCVLLIILSGWFFIDYVPEAHGETKTATTLGALLIGSGVIVMWFGLFKLFKQRQPD